MNCACSACVLLTTPLSCGLVRGRPADVRYSLVADPRGVEMGGSRGSREPRADMSKTRETFEPRLRTELRLACAIQLALRSCSSHTATYWPFLCLRFRNTYQSCGCATRGGQLELGLGSKVIFFLTLEDLLQISSHNDLPKVATRGGAVGTEMAAYQGNMDFLNVGCTGL